MTKEETQKQLQSVVNRLNELEKEKIQLRDLAIRLDERLKIYKEMEATDARRDQRDSE